MHRRIDSQQFGDDHGRDRSGKVTDQVELIAVNLVQYLFHNGAGAFSPAFDGGWRKRGAYKGAKSPMVRLIHQ